MMLRTSSLAYCALFIAFLAGCNRPTKSIDPPDAITYSHNGCYGSCPAYTVEVDRNGHGTFEGGEFTAVHDKRKFSVTPKQFIAFVNALEAARSRAKPFDPNKNPFEQSNRDSSCPPDATYHTDDTGIFLIWRGKKNVYFVADYGCDSERNKKLYEGIDEAPDAVGVKDMIAPPPSPPK